MLHKSSKKNPCSTRQVDFQLVFDKILQAVEDELDIHLMGPLHALSGLEQSLAPCQEWL